MNDSAKKSADRREHQRYPLATSVQFYHGPSQREFPARSIDISAGGMLMYVPAATPVQPGQAIRLKVGGIGRPEFAGLDENPVDATVIRVNRRALLAGGYLAVGVRFVKTYA